MKLRWLLILRRYTRHPRHLVLSITGIALGVAVVLAIDLTNASSERAMVLAGRSVAGDITHQILSATGTIDESFYVALRLQGGVRNAVPILEGRVRSRPGRSITLLGFDPVAALTEGLSGQRLTFAGSALALLRQPGAVLLSERLGRELHVIAGSTLEVTADGHRHMLTIAGMLPARQDLSSEALSGTLLTDIATAQRVLHLPGRLSRIDLTLTEAEAADLDVLIKSPLQLLPAAARGNAYTQMTRAFRINLTALSLLALVIGAFLIYNTMTIAGLQRRALIATVRTLGLTRGELLRLLLGEALLLALAGLICGAALGIGLSHYLIRLASRTISDLYFVTEVRAVYLNAWSCGKALLLGLGATLLACYLPAREALRIPPELNRSRSRLETYARRRHGRLLLMALLSTLIALATLLFTGHSIVAGFTALALLILAYALICPWLLVWLVRLLRPLLTATSGLIGNIAGRGVIAALSRTQVAVTALAIAIAATVGVSIMISSFRLSVQDWLAELLQADVYIAVDEGAALTAIEPALLQQIRLRPGVARMATASWRDLWRDGAQLPLLIRDVDEETFSRYRFRDGEDPERWRRFATTDSVIVSEPYAYRHGVTTGDRITLPTDHGTYDFTIAGVYVDYSSDRGLICLHRDVYARWWTDPGVTSLSLYLEAGLDRAVFIRDLRRDLSEHADLIIRSNRDLREMSLSIFDRTFVITEVLRVLTIVIAGIGILGALSAIQLERGREFGVFRACGMTPRELWRLVLTESGLMGTVAGLLAIPLGVTLAAVLIHVINRRSFGWTMDFVVAPQYPLSALLLGLAAGVLAGVYPAWRVAAILPARVLRDE